MDAYEPLAEFVHAVSRSGAVQHVAVHARAAVLSGLSPAHNRRVPPLRPELVARLARDFPQLRVTLNGGLEGLPALRAAAATPALDGLMCGRWALRRPLDLPLVQQEAYISIYLPIFPISPQISLYLPRLRASEELETNFLYHHYVRLQRYP